MTGAPAFLSNELVYKEPKLTLVRQPQRRGYRFRYQSEGLTHGGIRGEPREGEKEGRFYPSIKLLGYRGRAKVVLTIVTADSNKEQVRLHAHSLVVNRQETKGYHVFELDGNPPTLELGTIAVQHVDRKNQVSKVMDRILQSQFLQKFGWSGSMMDEDAKQFADLETFTSALSDRIGEGNSFIERGTNKELNSERVKLLKQQATELCKNMDMSMCRLCFQVFCQGRDGHFSRKLEPVISDIIYDAKTSQGAQLKIQRMSKVTSCVSGDEEIWLIGDKLNPDDIEVRFFEEPSQGQFPHSWEAFGSFRKTDVTKQVVLVFKTPEYHDKSIDQPVNVSLELRRKSDPACRSEPQIFKYTPIIDRYCIGVKRQKSIPMDEILSYSHAAKKQPSFSSVPPLNNNHMFNPAAMEMFMQNMNSMFVNNMFMNYKQNDVTSCSINTLATSASTVPSASESSRKKDAGSNGNFNFPYTAMGCSTTLSSLSTSVPSTMMTGNKPLDNNSHASAHGNRLNNGYVIKTEDDMVIQNKTYPITTSTQHNNTLPVSSLSNGMFAASNYTRPSHAAGNQDKNLVQNDSNTVNQDKNIVHNNSNTGNQDKNTVHNNNNVNLANYITPGVLSESMIEQLLNPP